MTPPLLGRTRRVRLAAAAVAVDAKGNLHVAGYTDGVFPGQAPGGGIDAFLRRFDHFGQALSLRQFGGPANDYGIGVGVDFNGFAYVAGTTDGALPGQKPAGQRDAFLAKIGGRSPAPEARIGQACHALDAFMANVLAQSGNRIPEDRAAALIAAANQAKAILDCR